MIDESRALVAGQPHAGLPSPYLEPDPLAQEEHSRLLDYLPGIFADDPFLDGFLRIFESIWDPLGRQIDQLYAYFDPRLTPPDFLPWLGTWVDVVLDENWPEQRRRTLIRRTADLYRRRGTALALRDYLEIFTGYAPVILEESDDPIPFHFTVVFTVERPELLDEDRVRRIIESENPAHTIYTLRIERVSAELEKHDDAGLPEQGTGDGGTTKYADAGIITESLVSRPDPPVVPPNGGEPPADLKPGTNEDGETR